MTPAVTSAIARVRAAKKARIEVADPAELGRADAEHALAAEALLHELELDSGAGTEITRDRYATLMRLSTLEVLARMAFDLLNELNGADLVDVEALEEHDMPWTRILNDLDAAVGGEIAR